MLANDPKNAVELSVTLGQRLLEVGVQRYDKSGWRVGWERLNSI